MENFEQFQHQKSEEILKEMRDQIKNLKDVIYDLNIKMDLLDKNDKISKEKLKQKIEESLNELDILEEAYKVKVKSMSKKSEEEPETVKKNSLPKMEFNDWINNFSEIIFKAVDKTLKEIEEKKAEPESMKEGLPEILAGSEKELENIIIKIENSIVEKKTLENISEEHLIQKLRKLKTELEGFKNELKEMEDKRKKDSSMTQKAREENLKELENKAKEIENKMKSIKSYISLN